MTTCYVNKNSKTNGDHEVHAATCWFLPTADNRLLSGEFGNCADAVKKAKSTICNPTDAPIAALRATSHENRCCNSTWYTDPSALSGRYFAYNCL